MRDSNVRPATHSLSLPLVFACLALLAAGPAAPPATCAADTNAWGGREASPAVVNPAVRSPLQEVVSLRGTWDFAVDPEANGRLRGWMQPGAAWSDPRKIEVPGCWEAQGVGKPGMSVPWDCRWDCAWRSLRHVYMGGAWYRRTVTLPAAWQGKRVWLKVGGVQAQGWFWVNGRPVAHVDSYCGTYKYDVTDLVRPGQPVTVAALVRNDLPSRKGEVNAGHRWGGLYRDIELEAAPPTWIDNVRVQGDFDGRAALVHLTLRSVASENETLQKPTVAIRLRTLDGQPAGETVQAVAMPGKNAGESVFKLPLTVFRPWSPASPQLYLAEVTLHDGDRPVHGWTERFGVRKFEVRGDRFYLNNQPFFVRGYGDDFIYPTTLISPASREFHRKNFEVARRSGFVYVRLHTHCEWPEYFEAADEAGILVQPELPYYQNWPAEGFTFDPIRDLKELIAHYGRYVSTATYCTGNEGHLGSPVDREVYETAKRLDPTRLFLHQDGGRNTPENSDFRSGPINPWTPGGFVRSRPGEAFFGNQHIDGFVQGAPYIAHEYLNLGLKCDPRQDPKFTGAMLPPRTLKDYEASLQRVGLSRTWGDACLNAGHALQRHYQKQGIESARLDPTCDGYSYWTLIDVLVERAGQGLYSAFWEPKPGGADPDQFRKFNGPTALLLRRDPTDPIAATGQTIQCSWWISHFGETPLKGASLQWSLSDGTILYASGRLAMPETAIGDVRELGTTQLTMPKVNTPTHLVLRIELQGTDVANEWDLWVFPKRKPQDGRGIAASADLHAALAARYPGLARTGTPEGNAAGLLLTSQRNEALNALAAGRRVFLIEPADPTPNVSLGWWSIGRQTGTAMANHPAFGNFPHNGLLSPLWFGIIKAAPTLQPDELRNAEPLMVGEGAEGYSVYLSQTNTGKGRLLRACGLDLLTDTPERTCLLDALVAHAKSDRPSPQNTLAPVRGK